MKRTIKEIEIIMKEGTMTTDLYDELQHDQRKGVQRLLTRFKRKIEAEKKLKKKWDEMTSYETALYENGITQVAGIDEVGRGPLAGPVIASAVILPKGAYIKGLNDSKAMSKAKRNDLYEKIKKVATAIGIGVVSSKEIDQLNIYQATKKAMQLAVLDLQVTPEHLLVDAMEVNVQIPQQSIIKGDAKSVSIAAASIIAKVTRDQLMEHLAEQYPEYSFEKHMGYPTKEHLEAIRTYGILENVHRKSFNPIKEMVNHCR